MTPGAAGSTRYRIAEAVADAVDGCDGVASRDGGRAGEVATFSGPVPIPGIRIRTSGGEVDRVKLHVVTWYGDVIGVVAERLRDRVASTLNEITPGTRQVPIDIHVSDVAAPSGRTRTVAADAVMSA